MAWTEFDKITIIDYVKLLKETVQPKIKMC